jgi:hypothetical protein
MVEYLPDGRVRRDGKIVGRWEPEGAIKPTHPENPIANRVVSGVEAEPSEAQKKAGNYKMKHLKFHGLDITIETPRGVARSGIDRDGRAWSVRMPVDYGYIRLTEGADGDLIDCYLGPARDSTDVWVVDQFDLGDREFDEHKVMLGFGSWESALNAYRKAFNDGLGAARIGGVTQLTIDSLKNWLLIGDGSRPLADVDVTMA